MSTQIFLASLLISLALVFYSLGIWSERLSRRLKAWHVVCFWTGFLFDVSGTYVMHRLAHGVFNFWEPHTFTGQIALWLMLFHATWATIVVRKGDEKKLVTFHRYSLFVWFVWLIPYFGGMFLGMSN